MKNDSGDTRIRPRAWRWALAVGLLGALASPAVATSADEEEPRDVAGESDKPVVQVGQLRLRSSNNGSRTKGSRNKSSNNQATGSKTTASEPAAATSTRGAKASRIQAETIRPVGASPSSSRPVASRASRQDSRSTSRGTGRANGGERRRTTNPVRSAPSRGLLDRLFGVNQQSPSGEVPAVAIGGERLTDVRRAHFERGAAGEPASGIVEATGRGARISLSDRAKPAADIVQRSGVPTVADPFASLRNAARIHNNRAARDPLAPTRGVSGHSGPRRTFRYAID